MATAEQGVAATRIVAPQAGLVTAVNLTVGTLPATPAIELRTQSLSVQVPVQEQDAPYVKAGQSVQVAYTALGVTGTGTVAAAPLEPSTSSGTAGGAAAGAADVVTYPVTIAITDPPPGVLPGMSAQASWVAATRNDVLAIPTGAIHSSDAGDVVEVLDNGNPRTVQVTLGLSTGSLTQITRGLHVGEPVITGVSSS